MVATYPTSNLPVTRTDILVYHMVVVGQWYCLLDAPSKEAVEKHHQKAGITCEWITEVKTTA
jgi:hypothetical protein